MKKGKTYSIANSWIKSAHRNLPIESYERWLLRLFYLGWIVTKIFVILLAIGFVLTMTAGAVSAYDGDHHGNHDDHHGYHDEHTTITTTTNGIPWEHRWHDWDDWE